MPEDCVGLIPHLTVTGAANALEFYRKAFGAEEIARHMAEDGKRIMHAAMRIGSSTIFLNDEFPEFCGGKECNPKALGGTPVTLHQNVDDCDAAYKRAVDAGATGTLPPMDAFWGDRYARIRDPFGHEWSFTHTLKK